MRKVWELEGMQGEIIGITPSFRSTGFTVPRGVEIKHFLEHDLDFSNINWDKDYQLAEMEKSGIGNYIIIDDDSDMLYGQRNHFVHVLPSPRNKMGFNEEYFNEALLKLSKTVIDLNY